MAQPEDRRPTPPDLDPAGATEARYAEDDNLDLDAGDVPHNARVDGQPGRKTRQARKNEISNRSN